MASYGADRQLYPFTFEYTDCDGDCVTNAGYALFSRMVDDDDTLASQSEDTDKVGNKAVARWDGFSDGIAYSGPVSVVIDHSVTGNAGGAVPWELKLEVSVNDGGAWRTVFNYVAGSPGENRTRLKELYAVYDMTSQQQLNFRITFTQDTSGSFARHDVYQVYAKKLILGGGMF